MWIWRTVLVRAQKKEKNILLESRGKGSHCFIATERLAELKFAIMQKELLSDKYLAID